MKKIFVLLFVTLLLVGCAPAVGFAAPLMQLPDEARLLILTLVTAGVTWVLLQLSVALKIDLSGYVQPIAAVLAPIIVTVIENYLQLIPPAFDDIVLTVIHFIVLLLGSIGTFFVFKRVKNKQTKQLLA